MKSLQRRIVVLFLALPLAISLHAEDNSADYPVRRDREQLYRQIEKGLTNTQSDAEMAAIEDFYARLEKTPINEYTLPPVPPGLVGTRAGMMVKLNFREAPVKQIAQFYAQMTGFDVIVDDSVETRVTCQGLRRTTFVETLVAIRLVLEDHGLMFTKVDENTVRIHHK